ncbi:hypothetical protein ACTXT7_007159 [Hymenolepis weldensis]
MCIKGTNVTAVKILDCEIIGSETAEEFKSPFLKVSVIVPQRAMKPQEYPEGVKNKVEQIGTRAPEEISLLTFIFTSICQQ